MKRKGFLQTACTMAAALLLLAGCTQDELSDGQGEPLPEGKYPLTFNATIGGATVVATPQTRASVDNTFEATDYIGAKIPVDNNSGINSRYVIFKKDGADDTTWEYDSNMNAQDSNGEFYWEHTLNSYRVKAWHFNQDAAGEYYKSQYSNGNGNHPGNTYNGFSWTVATDQNKDNGYANSDFLYADDNIQFPGGTIYGNNTTLHFFHQTSKVVVHIIAGDRTPADITGDSISSMTIGKATTDPIYVGGTWEEALGSVVLGKWTTESWSGTTPTGTITPKRLEAKPENVQLEEGETWLASYEALVIPQKIAAGKKLFVINVKGYEPFYYTVPTGGIEWFYPNNAGECGGAEFTYYITIEGSSLSVTTSQSSIGWDTSGESGSGSGELK